MDSDYLTVMHFAPFAYCMAIPVAVISLVIWNVVRATRTSARQTDMMRQRALETHRLLFDSIQRHAGQTSVSVRQALSDAHARYQAASWQVSHARTYREFQIARATCRDGMAFLRPAGVRITNGGKDVIRPSAVAAGRITARHHATPEQVDAAPDRSDETPFYHPGGVIGGRPVPTGWYSSPWWHDALVTGAWTAAGLVAFDSLFGAAADSSTFHSGFTRGFEHAAANGWAATTMADAHSGQLSAADTAGTFGGFDTGMTDSGFDHGGHGGGFDAGSAWDGGFGSDWGLSSGSDFGSSHSSDWGSSHGSDWGSSHGSDFGSSHSPDFGSSHSSDFGSSHGSDFGSSHGSDFGSSHSSGSGFE